MLQNKEEYPCRTIDVSPGGLLVAAPARGAVGEKVVFYFEDFGRLEGMIVRQTADGFAVALMLPPAKRERLADLMTWMINNQVDDDTINRRHKRIVPKRRVAQIIAAGGKVIPAEIVDVSVSGVGMRCETLPPIGARVDLGRRTGRVVRHFTGGLAIEFTRLIPIEEFDEDIVL